MSEKQPSPKSSDSQPNHHLVNLIGNLKGVSQLLSGDNAEQTEISSESETAELWEAADAPQPTDQQAEQLVGKSPAKPLEHPLEKPPEQMAEAVTDVASGLQPADNATRETNRENELLVLIHNLNECNDVLLSRVAQLEGNLTKTHAVLSAEVEKAQANSEKIKAEAKATQERMVQQVYAEQAAAQEIACNAQQQVAKLLSQIEAIEQGASRQRLINENLQTELNNSQERIIQLERECALLAQEHADQAQARIKAETSSRDLRSRLQRQQRYTLQFKAALEKSLSVSVSASASAQPANTTDARPVSFKEAALVSMPKAHRIMPWAAGVPASFQGIDPHLEVLIRGVSKPISEPTHKPTDEVKIALPEPPAEAACRSSSASPEAKAKLWQDLERVLSTEAEAELAHIDEIVTSAKAAPLSDVPYPDSPSGVPAAATLSVKLNWQAESKAEPKLNESELEVNAEAQTIEAPAKPAVAIPHSNPEVLFTEPSPWGSPLVEKAANTQEADSQDYLLTMGGLAASSVSPVVQPLRSPKKIGSMASVKLPTFPSAKVSSFRR